MPKTSLPRVLAQILRSCLQRWLCVAVTASTFMRCLCAIAALRFFVGACSFGTWVISETFLLRTLRRDRHQA